MTDPYYLFVYKNFIFISKSILKCVIEINNIDNQGTIYCGLLGQGNHKELFINLT